MSIAKPGVNLALSIVVSAPQNEALSEVQKPGTAGAGLLLALKKDTENGWSVPADSSLTDAQYASFKGGELYVNVPSTANPHSEIRMQLKA